MPELISPATQFFMNIFLIVGTMAELLFVVALVKWIGKN